MSVDCGKLWHMNPNYLRRIIGQVGAVATALIIIPVIGEFFIKFAEEKGAYDQPSAKLEAVMSFLTALSEAWWYPWVAGMIVGFTIAAWIDPLLRKKKTDALLDQSKCEIESAILKLSFVRGIDNPEVMERNNIKSYYFQNIILHGGVAPEFLGSILYVSFCGCVSTNTKVTVLIDSIKECPYRIEIYDHHQCVISFRSQLIGAIATIRIYPDRQSA